MSTGLLYTGLIAIFVTVLHLQLVDMFSGPVEEFWKRRDRRAKQSKIFLLLSLLSSSIAFLNPIIAVWVAMPLFLIHTFLSLKEFRKS